VNTSGHSDGQARLNQIGGALRGRRITEDEWYAQVRGLLETAYLAAETVYGGSGSGGDGTRREQKRRLLDRAAAPGGRLIVCEYRNAAD